MSENQIKTADDLERVIGKTPPPVHLKVIDHLDETALRWLAHSPLAFAGFADQGAIDISLAGGVAGFADGNAATVRLPLSALDRPELAQPGQGFSSLFLVPGIGETLRVNGTVAGIDAGVAAITVHECYVHCAKALIRSEFWAASPIPSPPADSAAFVAASAFLALATVDAEGRADLSPKGDPAGLFVRLSDKFLQFADRPGNRRADSFRNILTQPRVAAMLLVPGTDRLLHVTGWAQLTTDDTIRAQFEVQGKTPKLVVCIDDLQFDLRDSTALQRANLWPATAAPPDIDPAGMFARHVRLNRDKGLTARLAGAVMAIPGLMQKGLDKDYKTNLY